MDPRERTTLPAIRRPAAATSATTAEGDAWRAPRATRRYAPTNRVGAHRCQSYAALLDAAKAAPEGRRGQLDLLYAGDAQHQGPGRSFAIRW